MHLEADQGPDVELRLALIAEIFRSDERGCGNGGGGEGGGDGAGGGCDGQILVFHDVVGLTTGPVPKFAKRYAHLADEISNALGKLKDDLRSGEFPTAEHCYPASEEIPDDWDSL